MNLQAIQFRSSTGARTFSVGVFHCIVSLLPACCWVGDWAKERGEVSHFDQLPLRLNLEKARLCHSVVLSVLVEISHFYAQFPSRPEMSSGGDGGRLRFPLIADN